MTEVMSQASLALHEFMPVHGSLARNRQAISLAKLVSQATCTGFCCTPGWRLTDRINCSPGTCHTSHVQTPAIRGLICIVQTPAMQMRTDPHPERNPANLFKYGSVFPLVRASRTNSCRVDRIRLSVSISASTQCHLNFI